MDTKTSQEIVEALFDVSFHNPQMVLHALTTRDRSINVEPDLGSGERMEILGDAILRMLVVEYLHKNLERGGEGKISIIVDKVINNKFIGDLARKLGIGELVRTGPRDPYLRVSDHGVRSDASRKLDSDALEAIFGAIILDQGRTKGLEYVEQFLQKHLFPRCDELMSQSFEDLMEPKNRVQQLAAQKFHKDPRYLTHRARFGEGWVCECVVGRNVLGRGDGRNRKDAEHSAAENAISFYFTKKG